MNKSELIAAMAAKTGETQKSAEASLNAFVEVVTNSFSNPVTTNGGQPVVDAFMRIYGIDIKKAGALSPVYLDTQRIN